MVNHNSLVDNDPSAGLDAGLLEVATIKADERRMAFTALALQQSRDTGHRHHHASQEYVEENWERWHPDVQLPEQLQAQ